MKGIEIILMILAVLSGFLILGIIGIKMSLLHRLTGKIVTEEYCESCREQIRREAKWELIQEIEKQFSNDLGIETIITIYPDEWQELKRKCLE